MALAFQLVYGGMRGQPPQPRAEAARRIEPRTAAIGAPERIDEGVISRRGIAYDAQDPAVHVTLEVPEQRLERVALAVYEALQQIAWRFVLHLCLLLPPDGREGSVKKKGA